MKIRDFMNLISATIGKDAPAPQLAVARGFIAAHASPVADVIFGSLAKAVAGNGDLYVCQSIDDPSKYMQFGRDRNDFVDLTDSRAAILVSTYDDYAGHIGGEWVTVAHALDTEGIDLAQFRPPLAS